MVSIRIVELIISAITIAIAYGISTTLAGFFQAWVAKQFGDDVPEQMGFLSLNPLVHIDPIGAFCLFFFGIGWGKHIPVNPFGFRHNWQLLIIFLSNPLMYVFVAIIALIVLLKLFGVAVINLATLMVNADFISLAAFAKIYPASSSLLLAIALILVMLVYIGVMFAVLNFILNGFRYTALTFFHRRYFEQNDLMMFLVPFLLMIFFARPLRGLLILGIGYVANVIAPFIGAT